MLIVNEIILLCFLFIYLNIFNFVFYIDIYVILYQYIIFFCVVKLPPNTIASYLFFLILLASSPFSPGLTRSTSCFTLFPQRNLGRPNGFFFEEHFLVLFLEVSTFFTPSDSYPYDTFHGHVFQNNRAIGL